MSHIIYKPVLHYRIRRLVADNLLPDQIFRHGEGEEVFFGQGPHHHTLHSALFCNNIHLAIGLVLHEGGVAGMIDEVLQTKMSLIMGIWTVTTVLEFFNFGKPI
ncbi:hypothetical protein V1506DRAFT_527552 [Lipomyces tetrasporus]